MAAVRVENVGSEGNEVAFGTPGLLFDARLSRAHGDLRAGSMAQGHKPDEYVTEDQLARCDAMLAALVERLVAGV